MATLVWFRQDLRVSDNPALTAAAKLGRIVPVYIFDDRKPPGGARMLGGAARWWLHHSLAELSRSLGGLLLLRGDPATLLPALAKRTQAQRVFWNRCYEPAAVTRDTDLKSNLAAFGLTVESFNAALLFEPWQVRTGAGGPFKVFTPFWRACRQLSVHSPAPAPALSLSIPTDLGESLADWHLLPTKPNWAAGFETTWTPGEAGARARLAAFLDAGLEGYADGRNRPDLAHVSRLSPHLHWGELSPRQIWTATTMAVEQRPSLRTDGDKFLAEIGWREFAYHLLFHFPTLPERNWKPAFDGYPWIDDAVQLSAWQRGATGYPLVDAGMRELWQTGYMHNRVRMVVASFLIKHLRIDWRYGEAWFWDTLLDADLANNAAGWQWVAGSGADAAPYFRIFNPTEQARKFDPHGDYIRRWCPELARLPNACIHAPFEAPEAILRAAGIELGTTYPKPIVDHAEARRAALEGYARVRASDSS